MRPSGGLVTQTVRRAVSPDAVVVIPGVMGSILTVGGRVVWGFNELGWYRRAWRGEDSSLHDLVLTDEERAGTYGRVAATGLIRFPAYAPFLRGFEPYTGLVDAVRRVVAHDAAVLGFAYDWPLPVEHNAGLLAEAARAHLTRWLAHKAYSDLRRQLPETRPGRLVLVAHSMGGLLVRALPGDLDVRATVTFGTPFDGAATAALILNTGRGAPVPLPRQALRRLARTLPGLHDLLPVYRCLDDRRHDTDPRRLTPTEAARGARLLHRGRRRRLRGHHRTRPARGAARRRRPGPDVPDIVAPGAEWAATVTGVNGPTDASCVVHDEHGVAVDHPPLHRRDGRWQATIELPAPGIYRVTVDGAATSPVTQLVLADDP